MFQRCAFFAGLLTYVILPSVARADSLTANFTILNNSPHASGGVVTFTLAGNGTISASMVSTGDNIIGFGFESVAFNLPESNFSPTAPNNTFGWGDLYGDQRTGFLCVLCGTSETWTIGDPGEFTSVFQALGGSTSTHDFYFLGRLVPSDQWAADAVPEPVSVLLLGTLLLGLAPAMRRKLNC